MGQCPHSSAEMRGQVEGEGYLSSVERSPCCVCAQQRILDSPVRACPTLGNSYVRVLVESGLQCAVMYEGCDGLSKNVSQVWRGVTGRLGAGEASKTAGLSGFR